MYTSLVIYSPSPFEESTLYILFHHSYAFIQYLINDSYLSV